VRTINLMEETIRTDAKRIFDGLSDSEQAAITNKAISVRMKRKRTYTLGDSTVVVESDDLPTRMVPAPQLCIIKGA
jgi:hypothetical protein